MVGQHDIIWAGAAPLWSGRDLTPGAILAPDLVRFESDDFMEDLTQLLATAPAELRHRIPTSTITPVRPAGGPLDFTRKLDQARLYQPVHGHFNLVLATLTCRLPGLPDHGVDLANGDDVGFVLRRILPGKGTELAWVKQGGSSFAWVPRDNPKALHENEEVLPLFQVPYREKDRTRRLWAGLIPTSSRDTFVATPTLFSDALSGANAEGLDVPDPTSLDEDFVEARARVIQGLEALTRPYPLGASNHSQREREISEFFLLDLADLLRTHLPSVFTALTTQVAPRTPKSLALYELLRKNYVQLTGRTLTSALSAALSDWKIINGEVERTTVPTTNLRGIDLDPGTLALAIDGAYAEEPRVGDSPDPVTGKPRVKGPVLPRLNDSDAVYVLRCVYRRRRCRPPHPDVVSGPSSPFTIAPYLDPDAPYRPVRIALPLDTSIKGLRRFRKNVAFLMSNQLRKQMGQATDLKGLLEGKAGSEQPFSIGEICSFSIPVITICAFIVLMIFMILLNFVFWWLPFLKFCFPIKVK